MKNERKNSIVVKLELRKIDGWVIGLATREKALLNKLGSKVRKWEGFTFKIFDKL